jgi:ribosomal protein S18 acetylase RimI-like enzyme
MILREITPADFELFWPTFQAIVQAQETYAFDSNLNFEQAYQLWCVAPLKTFVMKQDDEILGSYYIKPNASGPSAHISNCGYMVSPNARGKGVARAMCEHSLIEAKTLGFTAMQFNSVVSTNTIAIQLWQKLGFNIIGTIPGAYQHKTKGLVDSFIMHRHL